MVVRYKGGSQYVCDNLHQQHGIPVCQSLRAAPIDMQVAGAFLEAVAPAEIDALSRAWAATARPSFLCGYSRDRAGGRTAMRLDGGRESRSAQLHCKNRKRRTASRLNRNAINPLRPSIRATWSGEPP
jgi:hypothetical protein